MRNNSLYLLISIDHSKTGYSQFGSVEPYFGVYNKLLGITMRGKKISLQNFQYNNSAINYPPNNNIKNNNKIFINLIAKKSLCNKLKNTELDNLPKFCFGSNLLNVTNNVLIVNRNCLNPNSTTHSDFSQIIPYVIVEFNTKWKQCSYICD